jgi:hypothetical protein
MPILSATYRPPKFYFKIPEGWDVKDICVIHDKLYYKGELKDVPCHEMEEDESSPDEPLKIEDEGDYDFLFSDEEE